MGYLEAHIEQMVKHLNSQKQMFTRLLEESPPGTLQKRIRSGNTEYVHSLPREDETTGRSRYIRRGITKDEYMIRRLADKEYARRALNLIRSNESVLLPAAERIIDLTPDRIRTRLGSAARSLPDSFFYDLHAPQHRHDMQAQWARQPYHKSDYRPQDLNKITSRGLKVRTKSELLIAEKLYEFDIPFRYEQVIPVGKYELAPDFTFLDQEREEFYLEYCGMMDDPGYADHLLWKQDQYERLNIFPWKNILYIYDRGNEIDMEDVEWIIRRKILPRL